ncbi:ABC transporter permease [Corynebacterium incognita]|uniref:ABC transporter permease n=1 Tax=Corynebacterium incognita TaxID=2754725 RepID=A0A7G7CR41_9CORY|nr:ABC transporter permease [Corynebacterium incognita]QNE90057.1 ABC transporter permease [Corynebacterium incognita]
MNEYTGYLARRIGQALLVLFITYTLAFFLLSALPSDGIMARYASPSLGLSDEQVTQIREESNVDDPLLSQYFAALGGFVTGNFGYSVQTGTAVGALIANAFPSTLALGSVTFVLALVVSLAVAYLATRRGFGFIADFFRSLPSFMVSLPSFLVAIVLIQVFSFQLGWFDTVNPGPWEGLVLPAITLTIPLAAPLIQVLIRAIDDAKAQPYVHAVRARGATEEWIFFRNVLRNAMLPALTMAGLMFGELVSGAVVTETVFGRIGLGALTVDAVTQRDAPVLLAVVVIAATVYVIINLLVDLAYPLLDPRLRRKAQVKA